MHGRVLLGWLALMLVSVGALAQTDLPGFLSIVQSIATDLGSATATTSSISSATTSSDSRTSDSASRHRTDSSSTTSSSSSTSSTLSSSSSAAATSSLSTTSSSSPTSIAAAATSASSGVAASASNATGGISSETRTIILAVAIPLGIIFLAVIVVVVLLCCCRRRHRDDDSDNEKRKFLGRAQWHHHDDTAYHGVSEPAGAVIANTNDHHEHGLGHHHYNTPVSHDDSYISQHDSAPLIGTAYKRAPSTIPEHPSEDHPVSLVTSANPFGAGSVVTRKPVPNRDSTGSNLSSVNSEHHSRHSGLAAGVGVGAAAGALAAHHHHQQQPNVQHVSDADAMPYHPSNRISNNHGSNGQSTLHGGFQNPLASHPYEPTALYATAGPTVASAEAERPNTPPFSPDDVGSIHRSSRRLSQGGLEPSIPTLHPEMPVAAGIAAGIAAPTAHQRRSLEKRQSSYGEGAPTPHQRRSLERRQGSYGDGMLPQQNEPRVPNRRSLPNNHEMWSADPMVAAAVPAQQQRRYSSEQRRRSLESRRYSSEQPRIPDLTPPPPMPTQRRYSGFRTPQSSSSETPSLPSNRHLAIARGLSNNNSSSSGTDTSTSLESYDDVPQDINIDAWQHDDSGRYPRVKSNNTLGSMSRFSNGSAESRLPLIPPQPTWKDDQRRWSDGARPNIRRFSSGPVADSPITQRMRYQHCSPEFYSEDSNGFVGQAM